MNVETFQRRRIDGWNIQLKFSRTSCSQSSAVMKKAPPDLARFLDMLSREIRIYALGIFVGITWRSSWWIGLEWFCRATLITGLGAKECFFPRYVAHGFHVKKDGMSIFRSEHHGWHAGMPSWESAQAKDFSSPSSAVLRSGCGRYIRSASGVQTFPVWKLDVAKNTAILSSTLLLNFNKSFVFHVPDTFLCIHSLAWTCWLCFC